MKGLKPNIARYIGILNDSSLQLLKDNVRKYKMVELMVTDEINQFPPVIATDIITHKLNKISNEFSEKINLFNEDNNKFKNAVENFIKPQVQNHNFNKPNGFKKNGNFLANNRINNYNIKQREFYFFRNKNISNNTNKMQCTICSRNNHSIENCRFKNNLINC